MFRYSRDMPNFRAFRHMGASAVHLLANGIVESRRLAFLIGAPVSDPIPSPVDDSGVADRGIGVGDQEFNLRARALHVGDSAGHEPRLGIFRRAILDKKPRKLPRNRDAVTLGRFTRRQGEHNYADVGHLIFAQKANTTNSYTGPSVKIMLHHQVLHVTTNCWLHGVGVHTNPFDGRRVTSVATAPAIGLLGPPRRLSMGPHQPSDAAQDQYPKDCPLDAFHCHTATFLHPHSRAALTLIAP